MTTQDRKGFYASDLLARIRASNNSATKAPIITNNVGQIEQHEPLNVGSTLLLSDAVGTSRAVKSTSPSSSAVVLAYQKEATKAIQRLQKEVATLAARNEALVQEKRNVELDAAQNKRKNGDAIAQLRARLALQHETNQPKVPNTRTPGAPNSSAKRIVNRPQQRQTISATRGSPKGRSPTVSVNLHLQTHMSLTEADAVAEHLARNYSPGQPSPDRLMYLWDQPVESPPIATQQGVVLMRDGRSTGIDGDSSDESIPPPPPPPREGSRVLPNPLHRPARPRHRLSEQAATPFDEGEEKADQWHSSQSSSSNVGAKAYSNPHLTSPPPPPPPPPPAPPLASPSANIHLVPKGSEQNRDIGTDNDTDMCMDTYTSMSSLIADKPDPEAATDTHAATTPDNTTAIGAEANSYRTDRSPVISREFTHGFQGPTFNELMRRVTPVQRTFPDQLRKHSVREATPASVKGGGDGINIRVTKKRGSGITTDTIY